MWSWMSMLDRLSGGDITKFDQIYEKNYIECLNLLAYWAFRDKAIKQNNLIRAANGK